MENLLIYKGKVRNIYKQIPPSYIKKIGWKEIINNYYEKKKSKKN